MREADRMLIAIREPRRVTEIWPIALAEPGRDALPAAGAWATDAQVLTGIRGLWHRLQAWWHSTPPAYRRPHPAAASAVVLTWSPGRGWCVERQG